MKKALIFGISGQDGSYLAEHLLEEGYKVYGMVRRHSIAEHQDYRLKHLEGQIETSYGDLLDISSLTSIINKSQPDIIFNLAAQSHVRISFDIPHFTIQNNLLGLLNILEICKNNQDIKIYQASSSEMFGISVDNDDYQRESTPMIPTSPYGISKVGCYNLIRHYRDGYSLFASNGILFNHGSPRRGSNFVDQKIITTAVEIKLGLKNGLVLGNLEAERDFGHAYDYTRCMLQIMKHDQPDDFVIATGETRSIRYFCEYVFNKLDLDYTNYVTQDPKFFRAEELPYLCGDSSKFRNTFPDFKFKYTFESMIDEIIEFHMKRLSKKIL